MSDLNNCDREDIIINLHIWVVEIVSYETNFVKRNLFNINYIQIKPFNSFNSNTTQSTAYKDACVRRYVTNKHLIVQLKMHNNY